jgi:competence/damage-inducible protein CinA-like protein
MPSAEIITIGTELLLGETVDTNATYLSRSLRDAGIDLFRKTTVGDNTARIAQAIQEALERCDIVLTTGGLGPTIDDPTRDAVAFAAGVQSEFRPELWEQIKSRFQRLGRIPTENNRRQAFIPEGALAIENPVGTAPIFILELKSQVIIALPGVPSEMSFLMEQKVIPYLRQHFDLHEVIKTRILHTVGVGESQIDDLIGDLEMLSNPSVGLTAHSGQVDVRITVKAESELAAVQLIQPLEDTLRHRLGDCVYGVDQASLEDAALQPLAAHSLTLIVIEAGLGGELIRRLAAVRGPFLGGMVVTDLPTLGELLKLTDSYRLSHNANLGLGVSIHPNDDAQELHQVLITPNETKNFTRRYGGPSEYASTWAINQSLDLIRRLTHDS